MLPILLMGSRYQLLESRATTATMLECDGDSEHNAVLQTLLTFAENAVARVERGKEESQRLRTHHVRVLETLRGMLDETRGLYSSGQEWPVMQFMSLVSEATQSHIPGVVQGPESTQFVYWGPHSSCWVSDLGPRALIRWRDNHFSAVTATSVPCQVAEQVFLSPYKTVMASAGTDLGEVLRCPTGNLNRGIWRADRVLLTGLP